ncbi:hypothetical protein CSV79_10845 [Sporosarcina sp. P13]|uniref:hypothetical protein n=1 Tax=Sporosarcina sp. P13 TaxID=2048263 RepID=UPI000C169ADE|nr:hypothetical protein [Sporosarcina sp. P13]PIC63629.1 hypothetical protein CSV79_10845 [Sporosarcina sp. P13]
MGFFIASIGLIAIIIGAIGFIVLLILKKPKKVAAIVVIIGVLLYLIGAVITPPDELGKSETLETTVTTLR